MSRNYTDEQVDKMMENILNNEQLKNKMLKDFGFDVKESNSLRRLSHDTLPAATSPRYLPTA